jgi:hypothetical protein
LIDFIRRKWFFGTCLRALVFGLSALLVERETSLFILRNCD